MAPISRIAFERVDENDPTLAVDGLSDFLPKQVSSDDPTLAVDSLDDLFVEESFPVEAAATIEPHVVAAGDPTLDGDSLEDYFRPRDESPVPPPAVAVEEVAVEDNSWEAEVAVVDAQSDIQRTAIEFQRFAESFHAFASKCQPRSN